MGKGMLVTLLGALVAALLAAAPANATSLWSQCGKLTNGRTFCDYITSNSENSKAIAYRDSIWNGRSYAISATCSASTSKTFTWSVGMEVEASIKAPIFGGIKTKINGSVARATTTGYVTSASFKVPARGTVHCDRGTVKENVRGTTRVMDSGLTRTYTWSANAPTAARWWIY